jgi:16S rRNA (uracil1498-N3)-methyltransferase
VLAFVNSRREIRNGSYYATFAAGALLPVGGQWLFYVVELAVRIPRIYQPISLSSGQTVELDAQATVHLTKVLRLRVGDALVVFNGKGDGEGGEFNARVESVERRSARIVLGEFVERSVESPLSVVLLQGVSRGERMDYTVQKAVELGVARIVPVITERTTVNLRGERQEKRRVHWQSVVNSACEQSGRNFVPEVAAVSSFTTALQEVDADLKLVLHHRAQTGLDALPPPQGPVGLLIGPEGGLSAAEIAAAETAGFLPLRLGPRVLRTETAALAALSVLQWQWGDFHAGGALK